jgi:hypothetical protein
MYMYQCNTGDTIDILLGSAFMNNVTFVYLKKGGCHVLCYNPPHVMERLCMLPHEILLTNQNACNKSRLWNKEDG